MLNFLFTDIYDRTITVDNVLKLSINIEEDVPADDMSAVFAYFECEELKSVVVTDDGCVVFTGVVDEQQMIMDQNGHYIKIIARSMAALLLDNESMPISYSNPSVNLMRDKHLKPFSVSLCEESARAYFGTLDVSKGDSNYKTVLDFAKKVFSGKVRVNEQGELCFGYTNEGRVVVFGDGANEIGYCSVKENIRRCDEISAVKLKLRSDSLYDSSVINPDAINRGIIRERYVDAVQNPDYTSYASKIIKASKKRAFTVTLECIGRHLDILHCDAVINDSMYKNKDKLYVSALRYSLDKNTNRTVVTLKRKDV